MKRAVLVFVIAAAIALAAGSKMMEGLSGNGAVYSSAKLERGEGVLAEFIALEAGVYEAPCSVICREEKKGVLLFSEYKR